MVETSFQAESVSALSAEDLLRAALKYQDALTSYAFAMLQDWALAQDAVQETFIVLQRKHAEFRPGANVFTWARKPMRVKTALARATVLGTEFVMRADEDATKLDVLEGKVEFTCRASGKKVKVKSGFSATLSAGVPPSVVPLCSSNCILRECRGTNAVSNPGNFETQK